MTQKPHTRKSTSPGPVILPASEHPIREDMLPPEAVWIFNRLQWFGYQAYLVGGGVRDLLLGLTPKDFDLTTNAPPNKLEEMFFNCRIIGRRFRIVHVYFREGQVFEVSTFRAFSPATMQRHSPKREDNRYGTPQEDARRRDLTINGLFYDSKTRRVIDYVGGLQDLDLQLIRTIGPAKQRFHEDPVRMIRAIRHAARHHFEIEADTWSAIQQHAKDMRLCSSARVLEEFLRELRGGCSYDSFSLMQKSQLLRGWLPNLERWLTQPPSFFPHPESVENTYITADWGQPPSFWQRLATHDIQIRRGHEYSDLVLMGSICLPICWHFIFQQNCTKPTSQHWHHAVYQCLPSLFKELALSNFHWHELVQLFQTYWSLHKSVQQPNHLNSLQRSIFLSEAIDLFTLELQCYQHPVPEWMDELVALPTPVSSFHVETVPF